MKIIASSDKVNIFCTENSKFSFFNSPYPSHRFYSGIDIYPKKRFNDPAFSPVNGKILEIKRVECPIGRGFKSSKYDYLILLQSMENQDRCIKLLHVKPSIQVGEFIKEGEKIGNLIRSGFFNFWTDPHIHFEIRSLLDPIRAKGGFEIQRLFEVDDKILTNDLKGTVVESKPEYSLILLQEEFKQGLTVEIEGMIGLLDAGIPHYGYFGVHTNFNNLLQGTVKFCGKKIGKIISHYQKMCIAKCYDIIFRLNRKPVRLSFYIYPFSRSLVKIIPEKVGMLVLEEFEEVSLTVS